MGNFGHRLTKCGKLRRGQGNREYLSVEIVMSVERKFQDKIRHLIRSKRCFVIGEGRRKHIRLNGSEGKGVDFNIILRQFHRHALSEDGERVRLCWHCKQKGRGILHFPENRQYW